MDFEVETTGFDQAIQQLKELERDLGQSGSWIVGSRVSYAVYLEWGTRFMDPKPFFRPAIAEVRMQGVDGFIAHNTRTTVGDIENVDALVETLALALERRVKEIITAKGLVDTGTLRASVAAVEGVDPTDLPSEEEARAMADATASFEVNA